MTGYSGTPLWKKLGYHADMAAYLESAPAGYVESLGLPTDVSPEWTEQVRKETKLVHLFVITLASLQSRLKSLRRVLASDCTVWVSWPKKASGVATDVNENLIRETALPLGFVDIKVCAIDEVWSGLKLVIRKELR